MIDSLDSNTESIDSKHLKFLETLIDKAIKSLEDDSCEIKIQDVLKAIQLKQQVVKTVDAERIIWQAIDEIRREELPKRYPQTKTLETQIQSIILGLKDQVKNGLLPVKIITDTLNQGKSKESRFTYQRIGRLLSAMGLRKVKTHNNAAAIIWDDELLAQNTFPDIVNDEKQLSPSPPSPPSPPCPEDDRVQPVNLPASVASF